MPLQKRYLYSNIQEDLKEKMVFLGGPRQVGKTTLAKMFLPNNQSDIQNYILWDDPVDRRLVLSGNWYSGQSVILLDEIHKYKFWRSLTKSLFDKYGDVTKILVTGSARLDHFRKGGDSLLGRYHYYRLHPYSLPELFSSPSTSDIKDLLNFGGFPEAFQKQNMKWLRRWHLERTDRVTTQDLTDLATIKDISLMQLLVELLIQRAASTLSIKSLQEDLSVSPHTVERWIELLESVYFCYRIPPYATKNRAKAIKKMQKVYLWDWSQVQAEGSKFENMVASHLLKYCHYIQDTEGYQMELRYIQDVDKQEIDFVILKDRKPLFAVECKTGERSLQPVLGFYQTRYKIPRVYQTHLGQLDQGHAEKGGRIIPFHKLCKLEGLV